MSRFSVAISTFVVIAAGLAGWARAAQPAKPEPPAAVPAPTAYDIDPAHSTLIFRIKHFNVGYFHGRFNGIKGSFDLGRSVQVEVGAAGVDTANKDRDDHLRGPDFLDVKQFPTIAFKSTKLEAAEGDNLRVTGELTLHGVTKTITATVERVGAGKDPKGQFRMGWETVFTIKRSEFGITYGPDALSDEIRITLAVEGIRR